MTERTYEIYECNGEYFSYEGITEERPFLPRFGLKLKWTWADLWNKIETLNSPDPDDPKSIVIYKVIFLARHASGTNTLEDSGEVNDQDAVPKRDSPLVQDGYIQASNVQALWRAEQGQGLGIPNISYCSPAMRALVTNSISFAPRLGPKEDPKTLVYEILREKEFRHDKHQINHRLSRDAIHRMFPYFDIDSTFAELDPLWVQQVDEVKSANTERNQAKQILDRIFKSEAPEKTLVSITGHGETNNAILDAVLFKNPRSKTHHGGVIPFICGYTPESDKKRLEDGLYKIQYVDQPNLFANSDGKQGDNIVAVDITDGTTPSTWNVNLVDSETNTYTIQLEDTSYFWNQTQDLQDNKLNDVVLGATLSWLLTQDQQAGEYTIQDSSGKYVEVKAGDLVSFSTSSGPKWNFIPAWASV